MLVCRGMIEDDDGFPKTGTTSRYLGARPGRDIRVYDSGNVNPAPRQGMSVSPSPPENLPLRRRPPKFDGTGKDPVFEMDTNDLPEELEYQPDPNKPGTHGFITPTYTDPLH